MKLYLIRHGQTEANARNLYYGSSDLPLNESGVKGILERVNRGIYPPAQGLRRITSGLIRAQQTYKLIYDGLDYEVEPDFNEMDFGDFEMHSYEELKTWPSYVQWISDYFKNRCPNGESVEDMRARVYRALDRVLSAGRDTLIVCHGGVIVAVMDRLFPNEGKNHYEWQPGSGEGYAVNINGAELSYSKLYIKD
jgi:broad specificity phosphatase PhoE